MILNPESYGYREEYDGEALSLLQTMAMRYVADEMLFPRIRKPGKEVPDGSYSDFSCNVWSLFTEAARIGAKLQEVREKFDRGEDVHQLIDSINLWNGLHLELRE